MQHHHLEREEEWFQLPKKLISDYSPEVGIAGLSLYTLMASLADEDHSVLLSLKDTCDTLSISGQMLLEALQHLERVRLIRLSCMGNGYCIYELLWIKRG